jgi:hypothetical protein
MAADFSTPKKRSKRGVLGEGRPSKQTPATVQKICNALAMGLNDEEAALFAGITDVTLTLWRRDPVFLATIKRAVVQRLYKRLQRIESGVEGWAGTAWCLERLYSGGRFAKPEVQISLQNNFNQTVNALSITISPEEYRAIEAEAAPAREKVRRMFEEYQQRRGNDNGNGDGGKRTVEVAAEPVKKPEEPAPAIVRKAGAKNSAVFWNLFASGDGERQVERETAVFVVRTIVCETLGAHRCGEIRFGSAPVTVSDCLALIDKLCGGSPVGWQSIQRKANFSASP